MKSAVIKVALAVAVLFGAAAGYVWLQERNRAGDASFLLARLERGPLTTVVAASGTLNAVTTVQVGAQISGLVKEIYADFNSPVKQGQVIARIDPASFELRVKQARALLDASREQLKSIRAQIQVNQAQVRSALATVKQRESLLKQAQVDLERTFIRAPVDGTVILRNIDAGQTVAQSPQAPVLFTIAKDLRDMQVEAAIDEADAGRVRAGQAATFTVDAFPRRSFSGEIVQIRMSPINVQNVVSYIVVISARNPDLSLLPGMTANVRIVLEHRENALKVPNAALRFRPAGTAEPPPADRRASEGMKRSAPAGGRVWILKAGAPKPVALRLGLSDGTNTELLDGPLSEGAQVIVGLSPAAADTRNGAPRKHLFRWPSR